jgi:nitroimidazol reductase NimA-like FMN-containing flavoprotein (pyridoxamine 5'-phosphate oxidase superfamily)
VHETEDDISLLQSLLDESDRRAGPHLLEIITPERRLDARATCERLIGMRLLSLATVSRDARPFVGPVDGVFFRGSFHFSSSSDSLRVRHIRERPFVSATHLPGEEFAVTVHGRAVILDVTAPEHAALRQTYLDIYSPVYGEDWDEFLEANVLMRLEASRMFTFHLD